MEATIRGRSVIARLSEALESRLWPFPVAAIVLGVVLGVALPRIDLLVDHTLPTTADSVVFNGGAETARSVLSSIAGSLITATSLTFSLTVVALQLASSQVSPRVLRLFSRDRQVHLTLAVFLGTFAYAITVLRSIGDSTDAQPVFVPRIAVTTGFVLTLVSVVVLVIFLAHLATQLRVETIMKEIHAETDRTMELVGDSNAGADAYRGEIEEPARKHVVTADSSGFITSVDRERLVRIAEANGIVVEETKRVGQSIVAGTPQAFWWATDAAAAPDSEAIEAAVRASGSIWYERTAAQDVEYGIQQLLDIAIRALSPGVNDPTTAVNSLGHVTAVLVRALRHPSLPAALAGSRDELRVVTASQSRAQLVRSSLSPVRHYCAGSPAVVERFLNSVSELAYVNDDPEVDAALREQLEALDLQLREEKADPAESDRLLRATRAVIVRLAERP
ncbi:DUF2254 domain-containing protein [Leifsonia sp. C5G2]|uniref:DUF2254 domain-containing protein n=1 Tax=Leifsonia sp. C5G2 TaxID=2735269 RepID=UPI00158566DF|nr:DUF2254 domain-containing protein [Leifsonia sp. C5G2]NUU06303.1 DUF2254 domain-containing protein [Leifsonia sp. C5G2]